jgi:hypothetical protein
MGKQKKVTLDVHGTPIAVLNENSQDYISLTAIARFRNAQDPSAVINNWMRARSTIEFLGLWEYLSNPCFKPLDFERFKSEAGSNYRSVATALDQGYRSDRHQIEFGSIWRHVRSS